MVVAGLILTFGEVLAAMSFGATELVLAGTENRLDSSGPALALKVAAAGLLLALVALVGLALGVILRNTAAAIASLPAVLYLPLVTLSLPSPWNHRLGQFSLLGGAYQLVADHPSHDLLPPGRNGKAVVRARRREQPRHHRRTSIAAIDAEHSDVEASQLRCRDPVCLPEVSGQRIDAVSVEHPLDDRIEPALSAWAHQKSRPRKALSTGRMVRWPTGQAAALRRRDSAVALA
jgi:hypothetical protein